MQTTNTANRQQKPLVRFLSERIFVLLVVAYSYGIILARFFGEGLPGVYWLAGMLLLFLAAIILLRLIDRYRAALILIFVAAGGIAFFFAVQQPAGGLVSYAGTDLYIEGTVAEEPLFYDDHTAYRLKVETVETEEGRFALSGNLLIKVYDSDQAAFRFGEKLRLRGTIAEPRGLRNPGGFDHRFYLRSQGIDALFYTKPDLISSFGEGNLNYLTLTALELRVNMVAAISNTLPSPSADLLAAVIFGRSNHLPEDVEHNFRRAGAGHLMAVSGLHVGLVAALILGLWRRLKLSGHLPVILAILLVFAYAYLTGMRPSALRAAIMISTALTALLLDREHDLPTAVAFAALVTLFINPLLLFTVGFQLSYAATLTIIYAYRPLQQFLIKIRCPAIIHPLLAVTLAAQVGVLPLSIYYFHHLSLAALLFNLLLLPLIGLVVGLGLSGALISLVIPFAGELLLWASRPLLELMLIITGYSSLPGFYVALNPPGNALIFIYYALITLIMAIYYRAVDRGEFNLKSYKLPRLAAGLLLVAAVVVIWFGILFPEQKNLNVTFIDVGQGAAAMIETPCGSVILVDAGGEPAYRGNPGDIGQKVLLPFLRYQGINSIDLAVISHPHEDHFGGFIPLLEAVAVKRILISPVPGESIYYEQLLKQAESMGIATALAIPGQIWSCGDDLVLEIIGPPESLFTGTKSDLNNNSIVFMLHYGEVRMLFTGDIEDAAVDDLLRRQAELKADLLLVPHHGGYLAAMPQFLEAVQPVLAVIQVGRNSFGHPHPFVLSSLEEAGVEVYRNDFHGAVIIETDGIKITLSFTEQPVTAWQ